MKKIILLVIALIISIIATFSFIIYFPIYRNDANRVVSERIYNEETESFQYHYKGKKFVRFFENGYDMNVSKCFGIDTDSLEDCIIEFSIPKYESLELNRLYLFRTESLLKRFAKGNDALWLIGEDIIVERLRGHILLYRSDSYFLPEFKAENIKTISFYEGIYPEVERFDFRIYGDLSYSGSETEYANHVIPAISYTSQSYFQKFIQKVMSGEIDSLKNGDIGYFKVEFKDENFPFYLVFKD